MLARRYLHIAPLLLAALLLALPAQANSRKRVKAKSTKVVKGQEPDLPFCTEQEEAMLENVERVLVFDSLVVRKADLLAALPLPADAGRLEWIDANAPEKGTRYISGFGDACYEGEATHEAQPMNLQKRLRIGEQWSEGEYLFSQEEGDSTAATCQSYAYMLADGTTLYLAQKAEDGLGGLDIYMTTQGTDGRSFYKPENVGMPFNSTANDYLMIINEEAGVGYFASDRGQAEDSVCVYYFQPNTMHATYPTEAYSPAERLMLGRLTSIARTWGQDGEATRLRESFEAYKRKWQLAQQQRLSTNDKYVAQQSYEEQVRTLENLRKQWHEGNHDERLRELIMELEDKVFQLRKDHHIRN